MTKVKGLFINEGEYDLENGEKGKVAVFTYHGSGDPYRILRWAVKSYVGDNTYHELIDANIDNPWVRVVVSDINGMKQESFNKYILKRERKEKLDKINGTR